MRATREKRILTGRLDSLTNWAEWSDQNGLLARASVSISSSRLETCPSLYSVPTNDLLTQPPGT